MPERVASLISGDGTTMEAVAKACISGELDADFACVIASKASAGGIEKARVLGIPEHDIVVVDPTQFKMDDGKTDQDVFGDHLLQELQSRDVSVVLQNGWMSQTPVSVINAFPGRIFNQHPGPVPEFGGQGMHGERVHAAILLYRRMTKTDPWTEVIAQYVGEKLDSGAVVKSKRVPILPKDTVDDLKDRALPFEHQVQIDLVNDVVHDNVTVIATRDLIVHPGQEETLRLARRIARLLYPAG